MKTRLQERILAREFRKQGYSFSEIMVQIPNLSKGTLNGWLKDIELSQDQKDRLLSKISLGADKGRLKGAFTNRQKKVDLIKRITESARIEAKERNKDPFFISGLMLYWAEGDKTQERVGFTNSDPLMIKYMMKWFREICNVSEVKFRIYLSIMTLHNKEESEKFWAKITGVPLNQFGKIRIKQTTLKGKRNPSYMGTCRIVISHKNLFRRIMGWKLGILENFNIFALIA